MLEDDGNEPPLEQNGQNPTGKITVKSQTWPRPKVAINSGPKESKGHVDEKTREPVTNHDFRLWTPRILGPPHNAEVAGVYVRHHCV
ncbi:hypothetical protein TNCV_1226281 [Trichonephila clavipes]|nr:hypothetical protein TNCV_1226281 [Trichonephila clavipes]